MPIPVDIQSFPIDVTNEMTLDVYEATNVVIDTTNELTFGSVAGYVQVITIDTIADLALDGWLIPLNREFVEWSKIGDAFDFTKDDSHESGRMPMEWGGWVYQAKQLGNDMVMYGENGVSVMSPREQYWASKMVLPVGLKGKNAQAGTKDWHIFVDKTDSLWEFEAGSGLKQHDYSQFLSLLGNDLVITYDDRLQSFYISDPFYTFIFNKSGLGRGPKGISGMGYRYGTFYIVGPSPIITEPFHVRTPIYDLGNRGVKTITSMKLGTDVTQDLYGAIDYRWNKAQDFFTTPWVKADRFGVVSLVASGIEFRFKVTLNLYAFMKLDYIGLEGLTEETNG